MKPESTPPRAFNLLATARRGHPRFLEELRPFGFQPTQYANVAVARVPEPGRVLQQVRAGKASRPPRFQAVARLVPIQRVFSANGHGDAETLLGRVADELRSFAPSLAGRTFHVRFERRGFRGEISSEEMERRIGESVVEETAALGSPARVQFNDPDFVVLVEMVGDRCGLSVLSRDFLSTYPFALSPAPPELPVPARARRHLARKGEG